MENLKQYGAYREFEHQPTEEEAETAMQEIIQELSPFLKEAAIRKHDKGDDSVPERWTIGIKFSL